jgi:hypothetical protein
MKEVKAYRCEHCGQLFMTEWRCKAHEANTCKKNPVIRALCYDCKHFDSRYEEQEVIEGEDYSPDFSEEFPWTFEANPHRCSARNCKLYNGKHIRYSRAAALQNNGYEAMKTLRDGGCEHYEPKTENI